MSQVAFFTLRRLKSLYPDREITKQVMTFHPIILTNSAILDYNSQNVFTVSIKHCILIGKNTVDAKQWLDKCGGISAHHIQVLVCW